VRFGKADQGSGRPSQVGPHNSWRSEDLVFEEAPLDYGTPLSTVLAILEGRDDCPTHLPFNTNALNDPGRASQQTWAAS